MNNNLSQEAKTVLATIKKYSAVRVVELVGLLGVSAKTIHKHLLSLLDEDLIEKKGKTPKVFYAIKEPRGENTLVNNFDINDHLIEQNYIYVSASGRISRGLNGFYDWCQKHSFDVEKEKEIYIKDLKLIKKFKKNGLISSKTTILSGENKLYLDDIFFSDFYTFGHFGKTKLGQLVYLGKSSQNKELITEIASIVKQDIQKLIDKYSIKFICFIPPTIDRKVQFLDVLQQKLKINLPVVKVSKVASDIKIPQKTLQKLEDRIINAKTTIVVKPSQEIDSNVLIIDDATGSGATINETAGKIRNITKKKIKIIGYSVVGSYKGFDVISEV
jgi:predicted amidophosphoribosyltransferase